MNFKIKTIEGCLLCSSFNCKEHVQLNVGTIFYKVPSLSTEQVSIENLSKVQCIDNSERVTILRGFLSAI